MITPSPTPKPKGRRPKAPVIVEHSANSGHPGANDSPSAHFEFVKLQVDYLMAQMNIGDAKAGAMLAYIVALSGVTADRVKDIDPSLLSAVLVSAALGFSLVGLGWVAYVIWPRSIDKPTEHPTVNLFSWVGLAKLAPRPAQPNWKERIERALDLDPFHDDRELMLDTLHIAPTHGERLASAGQAELVKDIAAVLEELALIVQRKYLGVRHGFVWVMAATLTHVAIWTVAGAGPAPAGK
jgi:hypothetical protein